MHPELFQYREGVKALLEEHLYVDRSHPLGKVLNYALRGGKRTRPTMSSALARHYGLPAPIEIMRAAEYIHTLSLVLDDLRVMDDDDYRRNQLATHVKFGEAKAILAAQALQAEATHVLSTWDHPKAQEILAYTSSLGRYDSLPEGQRRDLYPPERPTAHNIIEMYRLKTGYGFRGCLVPVAIAADRREHVEPLEAFADHLGIGYQIQDDRIDADEADVTGKTPGSDATNDRQTLVRVVGIDETDRLKRQHYLRARDALAQVGEIPLLRMLLDHAVMRSC